MTRDDLTDALQCTVRQLARTVFDRNRAGESYALIAADLGTSRGVVAGLVRDWRYKYRAQDARTDAPRTGLGDRPLSHESEVASSGFVSADLRRAKMRSYLGTSRPPEQFYYHAPLTVRSVVGVGDFHGQPDPMIIKALVEACADVYVVGGDTLDGAYASRHPSETTNEAKARRQMARRNELAELRGGLFEALLAETGGSIKILRGNHDQWPTKRVLSELPDWILDFYSDPLELLVDGLGERVELVSHQVVHYFPNGQTFDTGHNNEFMYCLGDVLFSHLNYTASVTEPGVSKLYRYWFTQWERPLRLQHVRAIVHFHVHYRNLLNVAGGHMTLIEPGMGGSVAAEGYKYSYQGKWKPSVQGFVRFQQYQNTDGAWRIDADSIELVAPYMSNTQGVRAA